VIKFGGTCVAEPRGWRIVAAEVERRLGEGAKPVVVASALAGVSNRLEAYLAAREEGERAESELERVIAPHRELAERLGVRFDDELELGAAALRALRFEGAAEDSARVRAEGMAYGEILSTRLGERWLRAQGVPVRWRDARTLLEADSPPPGATPSQRFLGARCSHEPDRSLVSELAGDRAVITQGFVARDAAGRTVLLGRGGSDTAAALLAARLGAAAVEFFSDVPGIFTADPREVPAARLIPSIGFEEAEILAALGARVLHPRSLRPLRSRGIPLRLRWIHSPELEGTVVGPADSGAPDPGPIAIAVRRRLALVACRRPLDWQPIGYIAEIAGCFREHSISMDLIESSPSHIQATIDLAADPDLPLRVPALARELEERCEASVRGDVASVSLVGRRIRSQIHRLQPLFEHLRSRDLLLLHSAANDRSLSLVIPREEAAALAADLHATFFENGSPLLGPRWADLIESRSPAVRVPVAASAAMEGEGRGG